MIGGTLVKTSRKLLLFDIDGTLVDTVFAEQQSAERMLQLLGYLPVEEAVKHAGA